MIILFYILFLVNDDHFDLYRILNLVVHNLKLLDVSDGWFIGYIYDGYGDSSGGAGYQVAREKREKGGEY